MPDENMGKRTMPQSADVATGIIVAAVAGFVGFVALAMALLFFYLKAEAPHALQQLIAHRFPEPVLQKSPRNDLERFNREQRMALTGYAWTDRSKGVARIPIDQAMRIIASRGDHAYDPLELPADKPAGVGP